MTLSVQQRPLLLSGGQILTTAGGSLDLIGWPLSHWWLWMSWPHNASPGFLSDTLKARSFETFQVWMLKYMLFAIYALIDLEGFFSSSPSTNAFFPFFSHSEIFHRKCLSAYLSFLNAPSPFSLSEHHTSLDPAIMSQRCLACVPHACWTSACSTIPEWLAQTASNWIGCTAKTNFTSLTCNVQSSD